MVYNMGNVGVCCSKAVIVTAALLKLNFRRKTASVHAAEFLLKFRTDDDGFRFSECPCLSWQSIDGQTGND